MTLTIRNVAVNSLYYAGTLAALPAAALWLQARWAGLPGSPWPVRGVGVVLGLSGVLLQVGSIALLQTRGSGTPSPVAPPVRLVTEGPYAWLRNPINLGEVLLFLALAAWFAAWILFVYSILAWLVFHVFIVVWEEPRHERLYRGEFARYRARVPRWLPRRPAVPQ